MSVAALLHRHVFGCKTDVHTGVSYLDEQTVVYPVGHNIVIHNIEQRSQRFLPGTEKTEDITAMCITPNKKFVAVAERAEKGMITIFDLHSLKRRRILSSTECQSKEFVSVSFSPDSKLLVAQGGAPDWTLLVWSWEKAKLVASTRTVANPSTSVYGAAFSMIDNNIISVIGSGVFKQFKITESTLKLLPSALAKREPQDYLAQSWTSDDKLVVGTEHGDVMVIDGTELKSIIQRGPSDPTTITCLLPYTRGFVAGCDDGVIVLFEKTDEREMFKRGRSFRVEGNTVRIRNLSISPSEEVLIVTLENGQMFTFALSNSDILKADEMNFEPLSSSFHSGTVSGMDSCVRKPLVATCGLDKTVRVWNYMEKSQELSKAFNEEAHSVSIHPSGLHVLVGFSDKLRLLNILLDDLRPFKEFAIKACRECKFSNGGHMFAAVNGNTINIFATYTCENLGNLRGHNGKVRSITWSLDDSKIISCGMDGAVYEWSVRDFKRVGESVLKSCNYTSAACTPDGRTTFAVGSDRKIKEIADSNINKDPDAGAVLTQVAVSSSGRMLFAGTESGTVRSYKFPLTGEYQEYQANSRSITRMAITPDDSYLVCAGDDGSVFLLDVRDKEVRVAKREKEAMPFAEEILVTRSDLEEQASQRNDLKQKVEELTLQNEYQLRLKDMNHQEKVKELTEKFTQEIDAEKARYDMLLQEKNDQEIEYEERIKTMEESHRTAVQSLESQYQQKIMAEVERYQQLMEEKELLNERWDEQNSLLVENHERLVQELTDEYEYKLQEEQLALQRVKEEKEELLRELEETRLQVEDDADREIEELKERYESKLQGEKDQTLRLKGENGIMRKKFDSMKKEIDDRGMEIKALYGKEQELYQQITLLEKEIQGLKKEIRERDETIGDKEKRIYDLKKKNQELEKFKFVLDYKIKELKKQIEPRELEISSMKEQIREMDGELERYHKNTSALELTISDLKLRVDGQQREISSQRQRATDADAVISRFKTELHDVAQVLQEPKQLKDGVKKMYAKYVSEPTRTREVDTDIQKEYSRQRDYLEKTVESLKRKLAKDSELHKSEHGRIMQENVALIKEINDLRREIRSLKQTQRGDERGLSAEAQREIEMQREEIRRLRDRIDLLEGSAVMNRPGSRERLPPMDGFKEAPPPGSNAHA